MRVLITGGAGFIGSHLADALLADERGRAELLRQSAAFMARYRVGSDGGAARRAAEEIVRLASGANPPGRVS